jgi:uncharacterized caspase-like protein/WD40 repeat protein
LSNSYCIASRLSGFVMAASAALALAWTAAASAQQAMPGAMPRAAMPAAPAPADVPARPAVPAQAAAPALPEQDAVEFFLDLDTGGHRAVIRDLVVTPDGEAIVSASEDKTVRVWDWRSGISIRTIRPEIGDGNEGKIYAIDVSPDGELLAVGGFFGEGLGDTPPYGDVRIFDLSSGRQLARLEAQNYATYDLDFSPDGTMLVVGGGDGIAYLWRRPQAADAAWTLEKTFDADSWRIEKLAFAAGGTRIAAVTQDNGLRLWNVANGSEIAMPDAEPLRDVPLQALAVTPDGARFATAAADGRLDLWNATDGTPAGDLPDLAFRSDTLAFTGDGTGLVVNCSYRCADVNRSLVIDVASGDTRAEYRGHDSSVQAAFVMPDGKTVVTAGGIAHEIHLWDATSGAGAAVLKGVGAPVTAVAIDAAGGMLAWGNANPCPQAFACPDVMGALVRQVSLPAADRDFEDPDPAGAEAARLGRAVHDNGTWSLEARPGGDLGFDNGALHLVRGGTTEHVIENDAQTGFYHGSFTLLRRAAELVTGGGDGTLIAYALEDGAFAGEFLGGHTGEVHAMAEAGTARLLATGSADQTIRLWNLETRELVVSMFFSPDDWVMWTPQGYYHSSPNGDALVGWQVNQGPDREARFVRARQLKQHLHSPEIVRRAIILGSAGQAVRELRPTDSRLDELLRRRPPEFEIRVAEGVQAADGFVAIEIVGAQEAGTDVNEFAVLSNEKRIDQFAARDAGGGDRIIIEVPVEDGQNEILISGVNEFGYVTERGVTALGRKGQRDEKKGKLWVVAVGVEEYPNLPTDCSGRSCDLDFPVDDAAEFLRVVAQKTAPLYEEMEALVMVNRDALDADPERAALIERLAGDRGVLDPESRAIGDEIVDFLDLPGPDDTTIVFIAGHGINIDEDYYFIPTDGRKQDEDRWRRSSLVDWSDIQKSLERAKGRRILLLDTCHAANAFNPRLEKDAADARIVVFSATAANNTAAEMPQLGHGVFTWSILEGLRGQANTSGDGVRLLGLADFVYREVVRLTQNRQEPFYHISQTSNFLLAQP